MLEDRGFPIVAVNAIIFTQSSRIILTRRADNNLWCLPGGLVEHGESVEEAIIREVQEEIGVTCSVDSLVGVYSANNKKGDEPATSRNSIIIAFRCQVVKGIPKVSDEVSEIGVFDIDNLPKDIVENQRVRVFHASKEQREAFVC